MRIKTQCVICKGRDPVKFCGRSFCPIVAKSLGRMKVKDKLVKSEFTGQSPTPFVGHVGYPFLNVGILSPPEETDDVWEYDAPRHWASKEYGINQIVDFRSALINSRFKSHVKQSGKMLEISQEVGMASRPVEIEVDLKEKPEFRVNTDSFLAPTGPNASLKNIEITSNPHVSGKVEKVVGDVHLKAGKGMLYLYKKGFDENFLTKILSVGNLGVKKDRKLVPTRWSITAVDDTVGKEMIKQIKEYNSTNYLTFFGGYMGNYYLLLCFPEPWSYELFETYLPNSGWNVSSEIQFVTDYENYYGRKEYAFNTAGGYYAARISIVEKLKEMKKQSSVLALRFITGDYAVSLGVWVVREAARKAVNSKPIEFASKELMLKYASLLIKRKFGYEVENIFRESKMLKNMKMQSKLTKFI